MVVIRLTRIGKKKQAFYRVVVADSKRSVSSKFIEILGWYNPKTKELSVKTDRVTEWLGKGAQPSNTLAKLLKSSGMKLPNWVEITEKVRKPKKEPVEKPKAEAKMEVAEEATEAAAETAETPAEETATETLVESETEMESAAAETESDKTEAPAEEAITEDQADTVEAAADEAEEKSEKE